MIYWKYQRWILGKRGAFVKPEATMVLSVMRSFGTKKILIFFGSVVLTTLFLIVKADAASYDFYVDADYDGEEDGSSDKPFDTIGEAIKKASGGKIYIKNGEYDENELVLAKEVALYGQSSSGVVIRKGISMKNGSSIRSLTINGGSNAIEIDADADVEIENCRIKNFSKIGVNALAGSGKVEIRNSSIYDGGTKGMYIQAGRKIELVGNLIYDNYEEGIDIRAAIKGTIKDNEIYNNGESGIEIVVGDSDVEIKNNKIQKNGSSGIAVQFYKENKDKGNIDIIDNILSRNDKYGLDCNRPSGGIPSGDYWNSSVELKGNVIDKNEIKAINSYCGIIRAVDEKEAEMNTQIELTTEEKENQGPESDPVSVPAKTPEELEAERIKAEEESLRKRQQQIEEVDSIILFLSSSEEESAIKINELNNKSRLGVFFVGYDNKDLDLIESSQKDNRLKIWRLRELLSEVDNEELKESLQESIDKFARVDQRETLFVQDKRDTPNLKALWLSFISTIIFWK